MQALFQSIQNILDRTILAESGGGMLLVVLIFTNEAVTLGWVRTRKRWERSKTANRPWGAMIPHPFRLAMYPNWRFCR